MESLSTSSTVARKHGFRIVIELVPPAMLGSGEHLTTTIIGAGVYPLAFLCFADATSRCGGGRPLKGNRRSAHGGRTLATRTAFRRSAL